MIIIMDSDQLQTDNGLSFLRWFPTVFESPSPPLLKVGLKRELRFNIAMDSWAHRTPGAPYIRSPIPPPPGDTSAIKRKIVL